MREHRRVGVQQRDRGAGSRVSDIEEVARAGADIEVARAGVRPVELGQDVSWAAP